MPEFIYPGTKKNPNTEIVRVIEEGLKKAEGQCPCVPKYMRSEDTLCPCISYRSSGKCKCTLYIEE